MTGMTKAEMRSNLPDLDDLIHGHIKVYEVRESDTEPRRCYRVRLRNVVIDVVQAKDGWGQTTARSVDTPADTTYPNGPYSSLLETVALAGVNIHKAASV